MPHIYSNGGNLCTQNIFNVGLREMDSTNRRCNVPSEE